MNNRVRSRVNNLIVVMTVIVFALSLIATAFFAFSEDVSALIVSETATPIGNGEELFDQESGKFNGDVVVDFIDKLFDGDDPVEYIKSNGAKDWETYGKNQSLYFDENLVKDPYYVVPSSTINNRITDETKRDSGFVVTLGGLEWMVASLTLADIDEVEDNVIVTLYLSDVNGIHEGNPSIAYNDTKGYNQYSSSSIRKYITEDQEWSLFANGGEDSFAKKYLVQPKNIKYQQTQSMHNRSAFGNWNFHMPNEAIADTNGSGWSNSLRYEADFEYKGIRYDAWGDDYIWLPSLTETGSQNIEGSIWELSAAQRGYEGSVKETWLRSGYWDRYYCFWSLKGNGDNGGNLVSFEYGVRPAIHLNLSVAALGILGTRLKEPEDVTTTYNGDAQTLSSIAAADANSVSWYNKKWYEHVNEYIKVTYSETDVKNAGEYWAKIEFQQNWFDDVRAQVDAEAAENGWTPEETAAAQERRKPQFKGDPDTSDPEHMESDTVRWFKITVKAKEITLNKPSYNASTGVFTPATFANESELYSDVPVIATRFKGSAADGSNIDQIDTVPNRRGTYIAKAIFVKSATDKTEYYGNYVIKDADNITCTVTINRSRLSIVSVSESSKAYIGSEQTFALSGYSSDWTNYATLTLPEGVTLIGSDADGWSLSVRDAGSYDVIASINSDKIVDWCWNTSNFTEEIVSPKKFTITVTRKTLIVDFTSTSGGFLLQAGSDVKFGAEGNNVIEGDDVKITLEYVNSANPSVKIPVTGADA